MQNKIAKYPAYKDSGVEWLGEIPEHWELEKLGSILKPVSIKNKPDLPLLSITREKAVILRDMDNEEENHNFIPDDLTNYKLLEKGQFGMNKMKAWQGSYGVSDYTGIVSPAYYVFNLKKGINSRFFHLAIRSRLYISFFGSASDGVRVGQWDLSKSRMKEIPFLIPSPEEQTAISQFLDRKTALIDKAIDIKQQQIELLKERRQILIHRAVTRGLNPNVKMKDSGVEWIGEIPEGWEVVPGFRIFREVHRKNIGLIEENVLSLSYGKIIVKPIEKLVGLVPESFETYQIVEAGEIIVRCTDLQNDQTSLRTGLVTQRGIITSAYLNLKVNNSCQPEYYHWFLHALDVTKVLYKFGSGLRQNLSFNDFKRMPIVALPKSEQLEISAFCNDLTNRVDSAISSKEKEIHQLKEYKATLINSAVTGKIKAA